MSARFTFFLTHEDGDGDVVYTKDKIEATGAGALGDFHVYKDGVLDTSLHVKNNLDGSYYFEYTATAKYTIHIGSSGIGHTEQDELKDLYLPGEDLLATSDIVNNLTSTDTDKPLSAAQGKILEDGKEDADATILKEADVVNDLTSTDTDKPLSAAMGKSLEDGKEDADATILKQADIVDDLVTADATAPLSAKQGKNLEDGKEDADATILKEADVVDSLSSTVTTKPLSAAKGKALNDLIDALGDLADLGYDADDFEESGSDLKIKIDLSSEEYITNEMSLSQILSVLDNRMREALTGIAAGGGGSYKEAILWAGFNEDDTPSSGSLNPNISVTDSTYVNRVAIPFIRKPWMRQAVLYFEGAVSSDTYDARARIRIDGDTIKESALMNNETEQVHAIYANLTGLAPWTFHTIYIDYKISGGIFTISGETLMARESISSLAGESDYTIEYPTT